MPLASSRTHKRDPSKSTSSLTPQRKHHKLLKDGSGTEVWPDTVEKIFVDGLRAYWQSPFAASHTGRSRWRNQFLVDFLRGRGVYRTKKQVASHLQVLRNMWKGEPQFQLVAGADDLYPMSPAPFDNSFTSLPASPSVKLEDLISDTGMSMPATYPRVSLADLQGSLSSSTEINDDLTSGSGSAASSSVGSPGPPDFLTEFDFPPSPQSTTVSSVDSSPGAWQNYTQLPSLFTPLSTHKLKGTESAVSPTLSSTPTTPPGSGPQASSFSTAHSSPRLSFAQHYGLSQQSNQHQHHALQQAPLHQLPQQHQQPQRVVSSDGNNNPTSSYTSPLRNATYPYLADSPRPRTDPIPQAPTPTFSSDDSVLADSYNNRVTMFCLFAQGMIPLTVKLDGLLPVSSVVSPMPSQRTPPAYLFMRLHIPSSDDMASPSSLHGFTVHVSLARVWNKSTRCITRVYHRNDTADLTSGIDVDSVKTEPFSPAPTSLPSSLSYDGRRNGRDRDPLAGSVCIGEEIGFLDVSKIELGVPEAVLPDSVLGRCRWEDQAVKFITQEIVVDDEPILYLTYELDRLDSFPSAELLRWQRRTNSQRVPGFIPTSAALLDSDPNLVTANKSRAASVSSALNIPSAMDTLLAYSPSMSGVQLASNASLYGP